MSSSKGEEKTIYEGITYAPTSGWWTVQDIIGRALLRPLFLFYYFLLTRPISFITMTYHYFTVWYGQPVAILLCLCFPNIPFLFLISTLFKHIKEKLSASDDWRMSSNGWVFFVSPENPISQWLWKFRGEFSPYVVNMWVSGTDQTANEHSWYDALTTKDFWRASMEEADVRVPQQLARYENGVLASNIKDFDKKKLDVVLKITDAYLGIGDKFLEHGKDYNTLEDLKKICEEEKLFEGKVVLVLEWCRPCKELGVHQIDIITGRVSKDKPIEVVTCILWSDCTGTSSHSTEAGYILDYKTEKVVSAASWYSAYFAKMEPKRIGEKIPGLQKAVQQCIASHEKAEARIPWLSYIGWDCMITLDKPGQKQNMVFFEGNIAGQRLPRRVFLTWETLFAFIRRDMGV